MCTWRSIVGACLDLGVAAFIWASNPSTDIEVLGRRAPSERSKSCTGRLSKSEGPSKPARKGADHQSSKEQSLSAKNASQRPIVSASLWSSVRSFLTQRRSRWSNRCNTFDNFSKGALTRATTPKVTDISSGKWNSRALRRLLFW